MATDNCNLFDELHYWSKGGTLESALDELTSLSFFGQAIRDCGPEPYLNELLGKRDVLSEDHSAKYVKILGEYADFVARHSLPLNKYRKRLFFSLAFAEGPPTLREQAEEEVRNPSRSGSWLRIERQVPPAIPEPISQPIEFRTTTYWQFEQPCKACDLASETRYAFFFLHKEKIVIVDMNTGAEIEQKDRIPMSPLRPRAIYCSPNGQYLVTIYREQDSKADVFALKYDVKQQHDFVLQQSGLPEMVRVERLACISYRAPKVEYPIMQFADSALWYQDAEGQVTSFDLATRDQQRYASLSCGIPDVELSGFVWTGRFFVTAYRLQQGSCLVAVDDLGNASAELTDRHLCVTSICAVDQEHVAVSSTDPDRGIAVLNCAKNFRQVAQNATVAASALVHSNGTIYWGTENATLYFWDFGDRSGPVHLVHDLPQGALDGLRRLSYSSGRTGSVELVGVTATSGFKLSKKGQQGHLHSKIRSVFGGRGVGSYYAIADSTQGTWILDGTHDQAYCLGLSPSPRTLWAQDGDHNLIGIDSGKAIFIDLTTQKIAAGISAPFDVRAVVGDVQQGFWLSDKEATIFYGDPEGIFTKKTERVSSSLGQTQLLVTDMYLINAANVVGVNSVQQDSSASDMHYLVTLFKINRGKSPTLQRLGTITLGPGFGRFQCMSWDNVNRRLLLFLKSGSPPGNVVVEVSEQRFNDHIDLPTSAMCSHRLDELIAEDIASARSSTGSQLYLLGSHGTVFCLNTSSLFLELVYVGGSAITSLSPYLPTEESIFMLTENSIVLQCTYQEGQHAS